jgi:hypothetical protein
MTDQDKLHEFLVRTGEVLYGPRWQVALAGDLGYTDRTIRRWVARDAEIPPVLWEELRGLLTARGAKIADLIEHMDAVGG